MGAQGVILRAVCLGVSAMALAACGQSSGQNADRENLLETVIEADTGNGITVSTAVPDLPAGFTVYPGATVTSSTTISTGTGGGVIMVMSSPDGAEKVVDFYRAQAEAAGVTISQNARAGNNRIIGGQSTDGLALTASAAPGGNGLTIIQLTVGRD